jgi:hypothetical protein
MVECPKQSICYVGFENAPILEQISRLAEEFKKSNNDEPTTCSEMCQNFDYLWLKNINEAIKRIDMLIKKIENPPKKTEITRELIDYIPDTITPFVSHEFTTELIDVAISKWKYNDNDRYENNIKQIINRLKELQSIFPKEQTPDQVDLTGFKTFLLEKNWKNTLLIMKTTR